jgi:hypothetical protein
LTGSDGNIHIYTLAGDNIIQTSKINGSWSQFSQFGTRVNPGQLTSAETMTSAFWIEYDTFYKANIAMQYGTPTTINLPPYTNVHHIDTSGSCNDNWNGIPTSGNIFVFAQSGCGKDGATEVMLASNPVFLNADQTLTLSGIQAYIKGFLYAAPVSGAYYDVHVVAYISTDSLCVNDLIPLPGPGILLAQDNIVQGTTTSFNQLLTATNFAFVPTSAGTYYVCAYADAQAGGGFSDSHFSNFDGSSNGITNFKITITY